MPQFYVLDIDNCLVSVESISRHEMTDAPNTFYMADVYGQLFLVRKRPHLDKFINDSLNAGKRLIVWSAGDDNYVKMICDVIFGRDTLDYILTRNHQTADKRKNIARIVEYVPDFDASKAILIDDTASNGADNPDRLLVVQPYYGDDNDDELLHVAAKLASLDTPKPHLEAEFGASFF